MDRVVIRLLFIFLTVAVTASSASAGRGPQAGRGASWIDLTRPLPADSSEAPSFFDESVSNAPNFSVFQFDPRLSDLFAPGGRSELCFPSALAQTLIFFKAYHEPRFDRLEIPGVSTDAKKVDAAVAVRAFAKACHTHPSDGTGLIDAMSCTKEILERSSYPASHIEGIVALIPKTKELLPFSKKPLSIHDLRAALRNGEGVLLNVGWYRYAGERRRFERMNGHFVTVVGFDYNEAWGEQQIVLKIVNPAFAYDPSGQARIFDRVVLTRVAKKPGVIYPPSLGFTLMGNGFERTNLVDWLLAFKPN